MEYGLGQQLKKIKKDEKDSLNPCFNGIWSRTVPDTKKRNGSQSVLILVLMEYGLGQVFEFSNGSMSVGLNPCFNGIWSRTKLSYVRSLQRLCLNPCFNGIWSRTKFKEFTKKDKYTS